MSTKELKHKTIHFAIRLSPQEAAFLDDMADKNQISRTDYVRLMLTVAMLKNGYYSELVPNEST